MEKGRIIKALSGFYYIDNGKDIYECRARGILKKNKITPLVGDMGEFLVTDEENFKGVLEAIIDRESSLIRPPVANITLAVIAFAVKDPNPNMSLMDRFIALAEREGMKIILVITKSDLDEEGVGDELEHVYGNAGYRVIRVSSHTGADIDVLKEALKGEISVLAGPSGAGKSSLLNALDKRFSLQTGEVSQKIGRGKNTTRHCELLKLDNGAMVADTPGFSSLSLDDIEEDELKEYFIEFDRYNDCKFQAGCLHENEPDCSVKEAVERGEITEQRYKSYIQLLNEIRENNSRRYK